MESTAGRATGGASVLSRLEISASPRMDRTETGDHPAGLDRMAALHPRVTAIGPIILSYNLTYINRLLRAGRAHDALASADKAVATLRCFDRGSALSQLLRLCGTCLIAFKRFGGGGLVLRSVDVMAKQAAPHCFGVEQRKAGAAQDTGSRQTRPTPTIRLFPAFMILGPCGCGFARGRAVRKCLLSISHH